MKRRVTREEIIRTTRDLIIRNASVPSGWMRSHKSWRSPSGHSTNCSAIRTPWSNSAGTKSGRTGGKKIAGYLFYQPGSALEQARNLIQEYIAAVCMISCISLQELQQKVSYADSYEKNRRFWLDSFTEVLEHCVADGSVLPDVTASCSPNG